MITPVWVLQKSLLEMLYPKLLRLLFHTGISNTQELAQGPKMHDGEYHLPLFGVGLVLRFERDACLVNGQMITANSK